MFIDAEDAMVAITGAIIALGNHSQLAEMEMIKITTKNSNIIAKRTKMTKDNEKNEKNTHNNKNSTRYVCITST